MSALRFGTAQEAGISPERLDRLRQRAPGWLGDDKSAMVLLVARRGVVVLHEAFGNARPDEGFQAVKKDQIFPLASMTKPLTATLVMQLVEDGLVGLNNPVQEYIPEFKGEGKEDVLVFHLLTHTSGIRSDSFPGILKVAAGNVAAINAEGTQAQFWQTWLDTTWDAPLATLAGQLMFYDNHNYNLLGEIVRRASGEPLEDFARKRLFGPLGMTRTYYVVPKTIDEEIALAPARFGLAGLNSRLARGVPGGGGSAVSTAGDLAKFGQMFLDMGRCGDETVLSKAAVREMTTDQIPGIPAILRRGKAKEGSWGLGWGVRGDDRWKHYSGTLEPRGTFNHTGGLGSGLWVSPHDELVLVMCALADLKDATQATHYEEFVNVAMAALEDE